MRQNINTLQRRADMLDSPPNPQSSALQQAGRAPAWLERVTASPRNPNLRDIHSDLEARAKLLDEQLTTAQGQFDSAIEQLEKEHVTTIKELSIELEAVKAVLEFEERRFQNFSDARAQEADSELFLSNGEPALPPVQE
jgi:hypothetical protein